MLQHLLKITLRNLCKQTGRSIISILCVTVGLLCFSICSYYYNTFQRGNRLFKTYECMATIRLVEHPEWMVNIPLNEINKLGKDEIKAAAISYNTEECIQINDNTFQVSTTCCNRDYFTTFPSKVIEGTLDEFEKRPDIVVITDKFVKEYMPNAHLSIIGNIITINQKNYSIGAVIESYPAGVNNYLDSYDLFVPNNEAFGTITLLLNNPSDLSILNKRIAQVDFMQNEGEYQLYLLSQLPYKPGIELWISIIGLIILIIALTNYFSFSIGNFANRTRELSLRRHMGGRTSNIFLILFSEQFIILLLSGTLAMALSESILPMIFSHMDYEIRKGLQIEIPALLKHELMYFLIILLISFCLCYATVHQLLYRMYKKGLSGRQSKGKHALRNVSLTIQFFCALVFLIGIMGVHFQMKSLSDSMSPILTKQEKENLIIIPSTSHDGGLNKDLPELCDYFRSKSWCNSLSLYTFSMININRNRVILNFVTEDFLKQMKVERKHHQGDAFAYITPDIDKDIRKDSVFSTITSLNGNEYPITGICPIYPNPGYNTPYLILLPLEKGNEVDKIILQLMPEANRHQVLKDISEKINSYYPSNRPYKEKTLYDEEIGYLNILRNLFIACTIISILITILGIFHSIQIDTERRQKEVAIRKVNGARIVDIYWLFSKQYLVLYLIAIVLAVPLCLFFMIIADQLIIFDYTHPLLWIIPLLITAVVIITTISWRIYRIAKINPAEIIKNE